MTPKEKSKELFNKYYQKCADSSYPEYMAKDCALIAVDEILKEVNQNFTSDRYAYWQEVKEEIEKL
jgi:hypothetical protein